MTIQIITQRQHRILRKLRFSRSLTPTSTESLQFQGTVGETALVHKFEVQSNASWSITDNQSWLSTSHIGGQGSLVVAVWVNPGDLDEGQYSGEITINVAGLDPQTVRVMLTLKRLEIDVVQKPSPLMMPR